MNWAVRRSVSTALPRYALGADQECAHRPRGSVIATTWPGASAANVMTSLVTRGVSAAGLGIVGTSETRQPVCAAYSIADWPSGRVRRITVAAGRA